MVYIDALHVKIRHNHYVQAKAVYLAFGINRQGKKEVLGLWIGESKGAKFWLGVLTELKNRGLEDLFIPCCDGLKGLPEAIQAVYPKTQVHCAQDL